MRSGPLLAVFAATAVAATAGLVTVVVVQPFTPAQAVPAVSATAASVVTQDYTDERQVTLEVTLAEPVVLTVPVGGRLTAVSCAPGTPIDSGTAPVSIDGAPVLALATEVPMWRDMPWGARGADVRALHEALTALGYEVSADGDRATDATFAATRAAFVAIGAGRPTGSTLPMTEVMWLPSASTSIASCPVQVGQTLIAGDSFAETVAPVSAARVTVMPDQLAPGPRLIVVSSSEIAVDSEGQVTDPVALAAVAGLVAQGSTSDDDAGITAGLQLADPIQVAAIPPVSITTVDGVLGCVESEGESLPVTIVGSQLGETFVVFDGAIPTQVSLTAPDAPCR